MDLDGTSKPEWWAVPANVAELFLVLLQKDQVLNLEDFVTPESESTWGDFTSAKAFLEGVTNPALVRPAEVHSLAKDIAFVGLISSVEAFVVETKEDEDIRFAKGFVTLVWRPEFNRWMVSKLGLQRQQIHEIARSEGMV